MRRIGRPAFVDTPKRVGLPRIEDASRSRAARRGSPTERSSTKFRELGPVLSFTKPRHGRRPWTRISEQKQRALKQAAIRKPSIGVVLGPEVLPMTNRSD